MSGASPAYILEKINSKSITYVFRFVFELLVSVRVLVLVWVWMRIKVWVSASDRVFQFEEGDYSTNFSEKYCLPAKSTISGVGAIVAMHHTWCMQLFSK